MAFHYKPPHSKTWRIAYYDVLTKKIKSISAKTRDEKEAKRIAKDITAKHRLKIRDENLIKNPNQALKLYDALQLYVTAKNLKSKTKQAYEIAISHLIQASADKPLFQFNKMDDLKLKKRLSELTTFRKGNGKPIFISINTKANYTRHLHSFFNWLKEQGFIQDNIITKVKPTIKKVEVIPPDILQKIFNELNLHCEKRNRDLIILKYLVAYRANELLSAKVEDFDFKNKVIRINNLKANRIDEIPMTDDTFVHLMQMTLPESGRITNLTYMGLRSAWRRLMDLLDMNYNLHQLRKTRGTDLANKGVNPLFLHKYMRHENLKTTMDYYIRIDMKMMAAEINDKLK